MEEVKFSNCRGFVSISCFSAQLGKISAWDHNIQNLLKKAHLVIYISCILGQVLYLSEWTGKWNKPIFPRDYRVRATVCKILCAARRILQTVATDPMQNCGCTSLIRIFWWFVLFFNKIGNFYISSWPEFEAEQDYDAHGAPREVLHWQMPTCWQGWQCLAVLCLPFLAKTGTTAVSLLFPQ